jgi:5'-nucleotidase / UDP-sugar diphosphatase
VKMIVACVVMGLVGAGCAANQPKKTGTAAMAMDVAVPSAPPPQYAPQPLQPVMYDVPPQSMTAAPVATVADAADDVPPAPAPINGGAKRYTVRKGDTLWKIAESQYGNGNKWQRIASANPGLSPETLQAGQRIKLP